MVTKRLTALVCTFTLAAGLSACESESEGPEAQPAEVRDAPVTSGGQTPNVGDTMSDIGPPPGAAVGDTVETGTPDENR